MTDKDFDLERTKDNYGYVARELMRTLDEKRQKEIHAIVPGLEKSLENVMKGADATIRAFTSALLARQFSSLGDTPLSEISETIENSMIAYAVMAAHQIGAYELPGKDEKKAESAKTQNLSDLLAPTGSTVANPEGYL